MPPRQSRGLWRIRPRMTWNCSKLRLIVRPRPGCSRGTTRSSAPASPVDLRSTVPWRHQRQSSAPHRDASSSRESAVARWGAGRSGSWMRALLRSSECGSTRRCAVAVSAAGCWPVWSLRRNASVAGWCDWTQAATCPRRSASTVPAATERSLPTTTTSMPITGSRSHWGRRRPLARTRAPKIPPSRLRPTGPPRPAMLPPGPTGTARREIARNWPDPRWGGHRHSRRCRCRPR